MIEALEFLVLSSSFGLSDNWGHWRGPPGNGVAPGANPRLECSELIFAIVQ